MPRAILILLDYVGDVREADGAPYLTINRHVVTGENSI